MRVDELTGQSGNGHAGLPLRQRSVEILGNGDVSKQRLNERFEACVADPDVSDGTAATGIQVMRMLQTSFEHYEKMQDSQMALGSDLMTASLEGYAFLKVAGKGEALDTLGIGKQRNLDAINKIGNLPWSVTFSYGRALQANPQGMEAKLGLGQSYLMLGAGDEAAAQFRDVLARRSGDTVARRGLASALLTMGQAALAEEQCLAALLADARDYGRELIPVVKKEVARIEADIKAIEQEIVAMLHEVTQ